MDIQEEYMPFRAYQTYYRVVGDLRSPLTPLLLLHGGPGSTHNYFEAFDQLAMATGRPIVMYDQLGCGRSSIPTAKETGTISSAKRLACCAAVARRWERSAKAS